MSFHGLELSIINARLIFAPFRGSGSMRSVEFGGGQVIVGDLRMYRFPPGGRVSTRSKGALSPQGPPLGWDLYGPQAMVHLRVGSAVVDGSASVFALAHKHAFYAASFKSAFFYVTPLFSWGRVLDAPVGGKGWSTSVQLVFAVGGMQRGHIT